MRRNHGQVVTRRGQRFGRIADCVSKRFHRARWAQLDVV